MLCQCNNVVKSANVFICAKNQNTVQPCCNAPRYSAVSVIMLTHDEPQFLAIKMHYNWNKTAFIE